MKILEENLGNETFSRIAVYITLYRKMSFISNRSRYAIFGYETVISAGASNSLIKK